MSNLHELTDLASWQRAEPIRNPIVTLIDDIIDARLTKAEGQSRRIEKKATADRPGLFIEKSNAMMD